MSGLNIQHGVLDITIIHWAAMQFFHLGEKRRHSKTAFFNPHLISATECNDTPTNVQEHINSICSFHNERTFFLAPYFAGGHWSLFIVWPKQKRGYVLDSLMNGKTIKHYCFPSIVEKAFGVKLKWQMIKCNQQRQDWECGYLVMRFMFEFIFNYQDTFPRSIWKDQSFMEDEDIDKFTLSLMSQLIVNVINSGVEAP